VRKLLTPLLETGLIVSTAGRDGGISLAHPPDAITIAAIYQASTGLGPFWSPRENIPHRCIVSCNFNNFFADLAAAADRAVRSELAEQTLADALNDLRARERLRSRRRRTD
jgi:Rrf2 family transcriptional repressor of oqxAB